jgi:restriction system protein
MRNESKILLAAEMTNTALAALNEFQNILINSLEGKKINVWESIKDVQKFNKPRPTKPNLIDIPVAPEISSSKYNLNLKFLEKIVPSLRQRKVGEAQRLFDSDYTLWKKQADEITRKNNEIEKQYESELKKWEAGKLVFLVKQKENNDALLAKEQEYLNKVPAAILEYNKLVLSMSVYPDYFPKKFDIDYHPKSKMLIVEYHLPSIDKVPNIKEVKYNQSTNNYTKRLHSESFIAKLYDNAIYQIALRTIHEIFEADVIEAIDGIVFNGWIECFDKSDGKEITICILSVQVNRSEFLKINLRNVDPKVCFKSLKGVGSSKLSSLTPIAPILSMSREDKRFVAPYEVMGSMDEKCNIAAMDWKDFENLIRELFEREFSVNGGEVKITRASRDSGVDAVAFDPDPIRGGKIVIQAKRYTNTVGVSAVRDLYGTVMNEGATKGILVSTTDYGPDAYEFAKGKPITLLNGSHLLHLLEKHGHKANIDLRAAKKILADKEEL